MVLVDKRRSFSIQTSRQAASAVAAADRKWNNWMNLKTCNKRIITFVTTLTHFPILPSATAANFMLCKAMRHDRMAWLLLNEVIPACCCCCRHLDRKHLSMQKGQPK